MDLALNNQQRLICYKTQPTNLHLGVVAIENEAFGSPSTKITNFIYYLESYDCAQTIITVTHLKLRLPTKYWLANHMFNHLIVCK